MTNKITKVKKRTGEIVDFNEEKIQKAIFKALTATSQKNGKESNELAKRVSKFLSRRFKKDEVPTVEEIQDVVEEVLILDGLVDAAKAYILYREQRRVIREATSITEETVEKLDEYIGEVDWQVRENANMAYSLQGLNQYGVSLLIKKYWLNKIYPKEVRDAVRGGDMHIHDLGTLATYCNGWDLYDLMLKGFGGVSTKIESKPPKHLRTALGQLVNFFYTLQGESAGAQAVSEFSTILAPFIRYDGLNYHQVKQAIQEFLFNCAIPTRVGFQCPFTNITIDVVPSPNFANKPVIVGGESQEETYGEFQEEINILNKALFECMMEGDSKGRPFHFPIPTVNVTKDFDWNNPSLDPMWKSSAKYGINYFANYINSDIKPEDARSMCCRLRLDKKQLYSRGGGGLFGSGALTGSIGVVTINLPRIGYTSKTKKDFFEKLTRIMDIAKESLEIKRKSIESLMDKGLYPYSRHYLEGIKKMRGSYFGNHFSTIGLTGMNETLLNFIGEDIGSKRGKKFALEIMEFMRDKLVKYQDENGSFYNLEATPAESTSYRLALKDKEEYPDIIASGTKENPYYTNSTQLPVNYTDDVFEALKLQEELQCEYTGGTVHHIFLGEQIDDISAVKSLVKKVFTKFHLPYITVTPSFSICPVHGYLSGEHFECPKCTIEQPCEVYSRIVGYLRPVQQWNEGKKQEFKDRKEYKVSKKI